MTLPKDPQKAEEYKKLLSQKAKGRKFSEEHKEKLRQAKLKNPTRYWLGKKGEKKKEHWSTWYYRNHERAKELRRQYHRRKTEADADRPKPENCECCGGTKRICYDHCHSTGKFRGWICESCNVLLGFARDDIKRLEALIEYLKKSSTLND